MNNLLETLVNQIDYVRHRTDDDSKGRFLPKVRSQKGDEELSNLGAGKEVTYFIHDDFQLGNAKYISSMVC